MSIYEITVRHLLCPLPVLKVQKHMALMDKGEEIYVADVTDDTLKELKIFQDHKKYFDITDIKKEGGCYRLLLKKL